MAGLSDSDVSSVSSLHLMARTSGSIVAGARVCVKPNRRFPHFASGDRGVAARVDVEARTCDVAFDGHESEPITVALKHLALEDAEDFPTGEAPAKARGLITGLRPLTRSAAFDHGETLVAGLHITGSPLGSSPSYRAQDSGIMSPLFGQAEVPQTADAAAGLDDSLLQTSSMVAQGPFGSTFGRGLGDAGIDAGHVTALAGECARMALAAEGTTQPSGLISTFLIDEEETFSQRLCPLWAALEQQAASQRDVAQAFEARLASLGASLESQAFQRDASQAFEARLARLENAAQQVQGNLDVQRDQELCWERQQAALASEIAGLRRAVDGVLSMGHEEDTLQRKHWASTRELELQIVEVQQLMQDMTSWEKRLRDTSAHIKDGLAHSSSALDSQEKRARALEEAVGETGASLTRLSSILESKESRISDLQLAVGRVDEATGRFVGNVEVEQRRLEELERRIEAVTHPDHEALAQQNSRQQTKVDTEPIWQALRELQELVVHESEHRAAGLREVLGQLETLRKDEANHISELETRLRTESRRLKQRFEAGSGRQVEHEKRTDSLDMRVEMLSQALKSERIVRMEPAALVDTTSQQRGRSPVVTGLVPSEAADSRSGSQPPAASSAQLLSSRSLETLQALEARFDRNAARSPAPAASRDSRSPAPAVSRGAPAPELSAGLTSRSEETHSSCLGHSATEGTLGKLRGQLQGLCSELITDLRPSVPADHDGHRSRLGMSIDLSSTAPLSDGLLSPPRRLSPQRGTADTWQGLSRAASGPLPSYSSAASSAVASSAAASSAVATSARLGGRQAAAPLVVAHQAFDFPASPARVLRSISQPPIAATPKAPGLATIYAVQAHATVGSYVSQPPMSQWAPESLWLRQEASLLSAPANMAAATVAMEASALPVAAVAVDTTNDGRANFIYVGEDLNRDGIPDALQGYHRSHPAMAAATVVERWPDATYSTPTTSTRAFGIGQSPQWPTTQTSTTSWEAVAPPQQTAEVQGVPCHGLPLLRSMDTMQRARELSATDQAENGYRIREAMPEGPIMPMAWKLSPASAQRL